MSNAYINMGVCTLQHANAHLEEGTSQQRTPLSKILQEIVGVTVGESHYRLRINNWCTYVCQSLPLMQVAPVDARLPAIATKLDRPRRHHDYWSRKKTLDESVMITRQHHPFVT